MTVINACLLYRRLLSVARGQVQLQSKPMSLHEFKTRVALALGASTEMVQLGRPPASASKRHAETEPSGSARKLKKPSTPVPCPELRHDGFEHYPKYTNNRLRCKREMCSGQTRVICIKCNVPLCFSSKQDCWKTYHVKWSTSWTNCHKDVFYVKYYVLPSLLHFQYYDHLVCLLI